MGASTGGDLCVRRTCLVVSSVFHTTVRIHPLLTHSARRPQETHAPPPASSPRPPLTVSVIYMYTCNLSTVSVRLVLEECEKAGLFSVWLSLVPSWSGGVEA